MVIYKTVITSKFLAVVNLPYIAEVEAPKLVEVAKTKTVSTDKESYDPAASAAYAEETLKRGSKMEIPGARDEVGVLAWMTSCGN
jgi:hypothetical protein